MALSNYRKVDISGQDGKRKIINTFINAIYVFDDHLKIIYNGKTKRKQSALRPLKVQTWICSVSLSSPGLSFPSGF